MLGVRCTLRVTASWVYFSRKGFNLMSTISKVTVPASTTYSCPNNERKGSAGLEIVIGGNVSSGVARVNVIDSNGGKLITYVQIDSLLEVLRELKTDLEGVP